MILPLTSSFQLIKDILFPLFCLVCHQEGEILCTPCLSHIEVKGVFLCPVCARQTHFGRVCESCQAKSFLNSHIALIEYHDHTPTAFLLHALKYNFIEEALQPIQNLFRVFFRNNPHLVHNRDALLSVPLHPRRLAQRGFNQSAKIAQLVQTETGISLQSVLKRVSFTRPQVGLSPEERKKNVQGAFSVGFPLHGEHFLLIDDVYTTGSTLQECAQVLKARGAAEVHGLTFARARGVSL